MHQLTCTAPGVVEWCDVPGPTLRRAHRRSGPPGRRGPLRDRPVPHPRRPTRGDRFALGHEAVVEVVAVGGDVDDVEVGALALPSFQVSCGTCPPCRRGPAGGLQPATRSCPTSGWSHCRASSTAACSPTWSASRTRPRCSPRCQTVSSRSRWRACPTTSSTATGRCAPPRSRPGADVLIACHGIPSIGLYAAPGRGRARRRQGDRGRAQTTTVLDARRAHRRRRLLRVDFGDRPRRRGLSSSTAGSSRPVCSGRSAPPSPRASSTASRAMQSRRRCRCPLRRLYTLGIEFHIGRAHSAALLPEVVALVADDLLHPGTRDHPASSIGPTHPSASSTRPSKLVCHPTPST